jgi:galactokinase
MLSEEIKKRFIALYDSSPLLVRSPGRVNLIGEHTDYNEGFVLPAAIDKEIVCAMAPNYSQKARIMAYDLDESIEFDIDTLKHSDRGWPNYIAGVIDQFVKLDKAIEGFDCVFGGNIPLGAGLSSSAAMECAFAYAFNNIFDHGLSSLELIKLAQRAENEFVGVQCGIMDQFASIQGKSDQVFRLDCKTLDFEYYDLVMDTYRIVLCDTRVKHSLASSEYNTRRQECDAGVAILQQHYPNIHSLRDVAHQQLQEHKDAFDPVIYKRCRYVVEENNRVLEACKKLEVHDYQGFGNLMYQSHLGLSNDYEVSCPELDFLYEKAREHPGVSGARMMGGGFGGCTINLVHIHQLNTFISDMSEAYAAKFNIDLKTYTVKIENGTSKL